MPVPWLTVPQTEVIRSGPTVADSARKLWQAVGKKPQADAGRPPAADTSAELLVFSMEATACLI